ncbi:SUKH-4 family immunity protein [Streptomyces sp. NPDC050636]|uniref:SUKH-4 family immunity protein n=1 Tax=Streptomyces sp. NPDC050636 TaxID=3154510 RepID=UPI0034324C0B
MEPLRIALTVAKRFGKTRHHDIRVIVEGDAARLRIPSLPLRPELMITDQTTTCTGLEREPVVQRHSALRALAAAETRWVALPVWSALCEALGTPMREEDLRDVASNRPDLLAVSFDESGEERVHIISEAVRLRIRELDEATAHDQHRIVRRLSAESPAGSVERYVAQALPVHAALAGVMEEILADGGLLVRVDRYALLQGLAVAWPDGVPQGSIATDIHYSEREGIDPRSHGDWISWLHWAAVTRGLTEVASGLAASAVDMPWRTLWSRWRPHGTFGRIPSEVGKILFYDQLQAGVIGEEPVAAARKVLQWDTMGGPLDDRYLERAFRVTDGIEVTPPAPLQLHYENGEEVRIGGASGWVSAASAEVPEYPETSPPWTPRTGDPVVPAGAGRWLIGGHGGLYAVELQASTDPDVDMRARGPLLGPVTDMATWQCPEAALAADGPSRFWLEGIFGSGACRTVQESDLPAGVRNERARRFLTTVGMPSLPKEIPFMSTVALDEQGLVPVEWPADAPAPESEGPFYHLGFWTGGMVLLDGSSGAVLQDTNSGYSSEVLASSLLQFTTLLALYREYFTSLFSTEAEVRDARWSLREWAERIDPVTEDGDHWDDVLDGSLDDPNSH